MQVTLSVPGRFHAFNLAQQLLRYECLQKLITSYPAFEVRKYGIPSNRIASAVTRELLSRGWGRMPKWMRGIYNPQYVLCELFDKQAARRLEPTDIFVGWSSAALHSLRKARELGAVAVVERGSSHMLCQQRLLEEEFSRFGLRFTETHPAVVEKELREYDEADYIVVPSSFAERSFLEQGVAPEKVVRVLLRGVDLTSFRQIAKEDKVFRVIYAGAMSLQKGIPHLLRAFSELRLPNAELLLIGGKRDEIVPFFEKYAGSFRWIGSRPQCELYRYYSQGSVFVMPSIQEGLAMVQVQAMACGLPLICTTNTGGEDLITPGDEGFVIPIRDVDALKEKILFFYQNEDRRREMGEQAKRKVERGFTWDDYGESVIETYRMMLRKRCLARDCRKGCVDDR